MHIKLINKILYFGKYKIKCAIGKRGISAKKREGDEKTPKGLLTLKKVYYRKDRVKNIVCSLKKISINKRMGWCDDPLSKKYNKIISFPFTHKAEKLYLKKNIYDILISTNYNDKPAIKNKGSAIFFHIATKKYQATKGCIAVSKKDMRQLLKCVNNKTKIKVF